MTRIVATAFAIGLLANCYVVAPASAEEQSCPVQSSGKKLAGAAKASFLKKCCEGQAAQRKLAGAAKDSFLKKCEAG